MSTRANLFPFSSPRRLFNWYPKAIDKKGTDGLKWYKNIIRGERAHGNQNTENPNKIIKSFSDLVLMYSNRVRMTEIEPTQNTTGLPEAKILAILFF